MSALPPCVDGSEMARRIFTLQIEIDCAASAGHR
jgi:hypothetical protein